MGSLKETLELLGMTREELVGRVVKQVSNDLLHHYEPGGEEGDRYYGVTEFHKELSKQIREGIDSEVAKLAKAHVMPKVEEAIENVTLQETNKWGEAKGEKLTFIEYLVARAEAYMREPVNSTGKSQAESGSDSYRFKGVQTRLAHMIHHHLQFNIENAVKAILANANESLVTSLHEAVKLKLLEVAESIKTTVKV